jgi:metal-responsive CopG/Arc/MetJ family transcriptional regulator
MKQTITVRISKELGKELDQVTKYEHAAVSDVVREAIRHYVTTHRFRQLRTKTIPYAEAQGIFTDEDVFKALK